MWWLDLLSDPARLRYEARVTRSRSENFRIAMPIVASMMDQTPGDTAKALNAQGLTSHNGTPYNYMSVKSLREKVPAWRGQ